MKNKMKNAIKLLTYSFMILGVIGSFFAPEILAALGVVGATGLMVASTAVPGTITHEGTIGANANHIERSISQIVTEQKPDDFPIDTLLRGIRTAEKVNNVKVEFETVTFRGSEDTTDGAFSVAGDANDASVDLGVDNIGIWGAGDTAYFPAINGGNGKPLRVMVMSVQVADAEITITAINGHSSNTDRVVAIADGSLIKRLGNAHDEIASETDIITQIPSQDYNYAQIQMGLIERSVLEAQTKAYSGYSFQNKVDQMLYDFRMGCEKTALYGSREKRLNTVRSKYVYHADGIFNKITQSVDFGTGSSAVDPSVADVADLFETVFAGNAGSEKRLLMAGKTLINKLSLLPLTREIGNMETKIVHGVTVTALHSTFGDVYIKHSKVMDMMGDAANAYVLDMDNIYKHDLEKLHKKRLNPDDAGLRRVQDSLRILENSCTTLRYPATHSKWTPAT